MFDWIEDRFEDLGDTLESGFDVVSGYVEEDLARPVYNFGGDILDSAENTATGAWNWVGDEVDEVNNDIRNFASGVGDVVTTSVEAVGSTVENTSRNILETGEDFAGGLKDFDSHTVDTIGGTITSVVDSGTGILSTPLIIIAAGLGIGLFVLSKNPEAVGRAVRRGR